MESDSAEAIQRWWRRKLYDDRLVAEKTRKIVESRYISDVTLQNDALIAKLTKLRKEKAFESLKYERILNMPARDVNTFINSRLGMEKSLTPLERKEMEKRHGAAEVIQRSFRKYSRRQMARKFLRSLAIIRPSKRIEYLEKINERLDNKKTIRAVSREEIRSKLIEHKAAREKEAELFTERGQHVQNMKRASISLTIASLDMPIVSSLAVNNSLTNYKAELYHCSQLKQIEENEFV